MSALAIIVVNRDIEKLLTKKLVTEKFFFTRINSTGGFLKKKNITLLVGLKKTESISKLKNILKNVASEKNTFIGADSGQILSKESGALDLPQDAASFKIGGATLFIVPLNEIVRY